MEMRTIKKIHLALKCCEQAINLQNQVKNKICMNTYKVKKAFDCL